MTKDVKVTICPPGKAYGYDRESMNKADRESHDYRVADGRRKAYPGGNRRVYSEGPDAYDPRDYNGGDPK